MCWNYKTKYQTKWNLFCPVLDYKTIDILFKMKTNKDGYHSCQIQIPIVVRFVSSFLIIDSEPHTVILTHKLIAIRSPVQPVEQIDYPSPVVMKGPMKNLQLGYNGSCNEINCLTGCLFRKSPKSLYWSVFNQTSLRINVRDIMRKQVLCTNTVLFVFSEGGSNEARALRKLVIM